ncbi:hypothetical protein SAMN05421507_1156 [Lentzea jiangxiensis]|uniref:Uncharacterized protein n=1 Tax=Lentzea jiangxiensis TaxID=641025 RepID=A0A1H0VMF7_9PSEU|nr:hypothetical protein SAMN05421507_1156 [Lentzea jiangxiensis]
MTVPIVVRASPCNDLTFERELPDVSAYSAKQAHRSADECGVRDRCRSGAQLTRGHHGLSRPRTGAAAPVTSRDHSPRLEGDPAPAYGCELGRQVFLGRGSCGCASRESSRPQLAATSPRRRRGRPCRRGSAARRDQTVRWTVDLGNRLRRTRSAREAASRRLRKDCRTDNTFVAAVRRETSGSSGLSTASTAAGGSSAQGGSSIKAPSPSIGRIDDMGVVVRLYCGFP